MTTSEAFNSSGSPGTILPAVQQAEPGSVAQKLIDFLQTLNDEFDRQTDGSQPSLLANHA